MASVEATRRQIEATRTEFDTVLGRLEQRVHEELDWKARLRRNRARLLVGGAGLAMVVIAGAATATVMRSKRHRTIEEQVLHLTHLDDVKREVIRLRDHLAGAPPRDDDPLWAKIALKTTTAIGAAAGTMVTKHLIERFDAAEAGDREHGRAADRAVERR